MSNPTVVQPYLFFEGQCEEAVEFYRRALGAEVQMQMRYKDSPEPPPPGCGPTDTNKIMHASFQVGNTVIMASDGRCTNQPKFDGFALSLSFGSETEAERAFGALAEGGRVQMALTKTFFATKFGMVVDRFGVSWMVIVHPPGNQAPQK